MCCQVANIIAGDWQGKCETVVSVFLEAINKSKQWFLKILFKDMGNQVLITAKSRDKRNI